MLLLRSSDSQSTKNARQKEEQINHPGDPRSATRRQLIDLFHHRPPSTGEEFVDADVRAITS